MTQALGLGWPARRMRPCAISHAKLGGLRAWEARRRQTHQGRTNYDPLTADKIAVVGAAFKSRGYRSFANYLSKVKEQRVVLGGEWTDELQLESRRVVRSVT